MSPVFPGVKADRQPELEQKLDLDVDTFMQTMNVCNGNCKVDKFDHRVLNDGHAEGLTPTWSRL